MMRLFANLFLLLFVADGGVSLLDEIVSLVSPLPTLDALHHGLANFALLSGLGVYCCLGIDRRLPKRVFLPLIGFLYGWLIVALASPSLAEGHLFGALTAVAQLFLCLLPMRYFRRDGQPSLLMPKEMFADGASFSTKNTLTFTAVNLVFLPVFLLLLVLLTANANLVRYTSGFMRIAPDGIHMSEKVYRRGNQTVRLAGMIHVAERKYYDEIVGSSEKGRTIVLAEGVTDRKNLLHNRPDYGKLASYLGLASQQEKMHFRGRMIDEAEFEGDPTEHKGKEGVDILRADVDISAFRSTTVWFLNSLGRQMRESPTLSKQLLSSVAWSETNMTPTMQKVIMDDVLYRRNEVLIRYLGKALERYDNVVIPWGALHMAAIEQEVVKDGFQLQQVKDRVSIRFFKP